MNGQDTSTRTLAKHGQNPGLSDRPDPTSAGKLGGMKMSSLSHLSAWLLQTLHGGPVDLAAQRIVPLTGNWTQSDLWELLVRPQLDGRPLDPASTVAWAEANGSAPELDLAIVAKAVTHMAAGSDRFCVNLSGLSVRTPGHARRLTAILAAAHVFPGRVVFEISERHALEPTGHVRENLLYLRDAGVGLAIDDFGAQCGNVSLLSIVDLKYMKADAALTRAVLSADLDRKRRLTSGLAGLADAAGAEIIFEGLETEMSVSEIRAIAPSGSWGQGYAIHLPQLLGLPSGEGPMGQKTYFSQSSEFEAMEAPRDR